MGVVYYKRFRMEIDLHRAPRRQAELPAGYCWQPWASELLERHALTKYQSFRGEIDAEVFPCLGDTAGCRYLMSEICQRSAFVPGATWLISFQSMDGGVEDCATIQGLVQPGQWGAIQNVGVVPEHRGLGLGTALVLNALAGFAAVGVPRVYLEVTACNARAVQLYRGVGFQLAKTTYKAVERPEATQAVY
jgi:hypothetical protein